MKTHVSHLLKIAAVAIALMFPAFTASHALAQTTVLINGTTNNGDFDQDALPYYNPTIGVYDTSASITDWISSGNSSGDGFANVGSSSAQSGSNVFFAQEGTWSFNSYPSSLLNFTVQTGDVFTLSVYASYNVLSSTANATVGAQLYINGYDTMSPASASLPAGEGYQLETYTYTAQPADNGQQLQSLFVNITVPANSSANYVKADTVTLTVAPVPEPSTWALIALAGALLAAAARNNRSAARPGPPTGHSP
jgi:hypothetical protein